MLDTSKLYKPGPSPDEKTCPGETSYRVTSDGSHAPDCPVGLLERMTFHAAISDGFRDGDSPSWRAPRPRRAPASRWAPSRGGSTRRELLRQPPQVGTAGARDPDEYPVGRGPLRPTLRAPRRSPRGPGASLRHGAGPRSPGRTRSGQSVQRPRRCHRGEGPGGRARTHGARARPHGRGPHPARGWSSNDHARRYPAPYAVVT